MVSIAYIGNVVEVWESFYQHDIFVHLGSDQTSLHNPWSGGYYPVGMSYEDANRLIREQPELFKEKVQATLKRHAEAVNKPLPKAPTFLTMAMRFYLSHRVLVAM